MAAEVIDLRSFFFFNEFTAVNLSLSAALVASHKFDMLCFHFHSIQNTFNFSFDIFSDPWFF